MLPSELKALRVKAGLTRSELDTALDVVPGYTGRVERGAIVLDKRTELAVQFVCATVNGRDGGVKDDRL